MNKTNSSAQVVGKLANVAYGGVFALIFTVATICIYAAPAYAAWKVLGAIVFGAQPRFVMAAVGAWLSSAAVFGVALAVLNGNRIAKDGVCVAIMLILPVALAYRVDLQTSMLVEVAVALCALLSLVAIHVFGTKSAVAERTRERASDGAAAEQAPAQVELRFLAVRPRHTFAHVVGMSEVKGRLLEAGNEIVASQKSGQQPRNGMLLTGLPGNGKTFMAEALAGELKLPFLAVSYGDVASRWINETTENVVKAFRDAAAQAPCLLFIDEIDSLIASRNHAGGSEESARTTNAILTELVNIRRLGVVVVAASNFVDRLDPAAIREGRFDFKVEITAPDSAARKHLIASKARLPISGETVETAVRRWEGFSVARISAVMEEANRSANSVITFKALQVALRTTQGRKGNIPEDTPTLDDLTMSADNKQRLLALARRMDRIMEIEAMGGSVPRGALFFGPPGTGKTVTARALAKTANWAFLSVSGMDLIADPKKIDALVQEASDLRPCVVFIDEADDVFRDRRYSNSATVTNKLLAAMDGSAGKVPDILFIAATNHPDDMDAAALRGGRFTEKLEFGLPDADALRTYLRIWKDTTKASLAPSFDLEKAAVLLAGNSMANVKEILQMSINHAISRVDEDADVVTVELSDLKEAIASVAATA